MPSAINCGPRVGAGRSSFVARGCKFHPASIFKYVRADKRRSLLWSKLTTQLSLNVHSTIHEHPWPTWVSRHNKNVGACKTPLQSSHVESESWELFPYVQALTLVLLIQICFESSATPLNGHVNNKVLRFEQTNGNLNV
ncbi:hypothetical protein BDR06DRAFT_553283 [Suillus hirtellus]|nr:hypothetical protein BDR06DRAFT_553283 [Suillus hirtellus]